MYDLAAAYVRQHGDLMIPHDYITDQQERLGGWLARQRELYRRKELEPRRIRRLEQLGIQWEPKKMRQEKISGGGKSIPESGRQPGSTV